MSPTDPASIPEHVLDTVEATHWPDEATGREAWAIAIAAALDTLMDDEPVRVWSRQAAAVVDVRGMDVLAAVLERFADT